MFLRLSLDVILHIFGVLQGLPWFIRLAVLQPPHQSGEDRTEARAISLGIFIRGQPDRATTMVVLKYCGIPSYLEW